MGLILSNWHPCERKFDTQTLEMQVQRVKTMQRHAKRTAVCKLMRETTGEVKTANTLTLDFWSPELEKIHFCFIRR